MMLVWALEVFCVLAGIITFAGFAQLAYEDVQAKRQRRR